MDFIILAILYQLATNVIREVKKRMANTIHGKNIYPLCELNSEKDRFFDRWNLIKKHINEGEFSYPKLTSEEERAIRIIANRLYKNIKNEFDSAIELYQELDSSFSKSSK